MGSLGRQSVRLASFLHGNNHVECGKVGLYLHSSDQEMYGSDIFSLVRSSVRSENAPVACFLAAFLPRPVQRKLLVSGTLP